MRIITQLSRSCYSATRLLKNKLEIFIYIAEKLFFLTVNLIKKSEIINSDQVEKMVDVFRTRGLHSWGGNHAVRLQGGALEMIRADQLPRREQLRYVAISKSSDTGRWAHRLLSGLRRALGFS